MHLINAEKKGKRLNSWEPTVGERERDRKTVWVRGGGDSVCVWEREKREDGKEREKKKERLSVCEENEKERLCE